MFELLTSCQQDSSRKKTEIITSSTYWSYHTSRNNNTNDWRDKTMIRPVSDIIRGRIELSFSHASLHILVRQSLINYKLRYWRKLSRSGEYHSIFWATWQCLHLLSGNLLLHRPANSIRGCQGWFFTGILNKCYKDDQISGHNDRRTMSEGRNRQLLT